MPRPPSAQTSALKFLLDYFSKDPRAGPVGVPTLAALARVSYATMWKAVRQCKEQGLLRGGYRVSIAGKEKTGAEPRAVAAPAVRLERRITRDLLTGSITRGRSLLSVKELTARYATSSETLRRALSSVESQGLIVRHGRHYAGLGQAAAGHLSIVLLAYRENKGEGFALPPLEKDFLTFCESACGNARISLTLALLERSDGAMVARDVRGNTVQSIPAGEDIAGYLYLLQSEEAFDDEIMRQLVTMQKPVAVLDGAGIFPRDTRAYDTPLVRIFTSSALEQPGKHVATYMLSKGHHHAAYISPFHGDRWSQARYEGARKVFAMAGEGFSLMLFAADHSIKDRYFEAEGRRHSNGHEIEELFSLWRARIPACFHPETEAHLLRLRRGVYLWGEVRSVLEPLLDKAANDKRISAWIMANDSAARIALQYCLRVNIPVPGRIAIIGLDDVDESRDLRITTYNFNFGAVAAAIVHYLLHPQSGYWQRRRIVEIEGRIVERSTT